MFDIFKSQGDYSVGPGIRIILNMRSIQDIIIINNFTPNHITKEEKMRSNLLALLISIAFVLAGCETAGPKTATGAITGGLIGATAGGIIGYQSHNALAGAGIGAVAGAVGGGLIGNSMDKKDKETSAVNPYYIPVTKVVEMVSQGTPDSIIISEIQRTHSNYSLSSEAITYLKNNKVSDKVIDYMLGTGK